MRCARSRDRRSRRPRSRARSSPRRRPRRPRCRRSRRRAAFPRGAATRRAPRRRRRSTRPRRRSAIRGRPRRRSSARRSRRPARFHSGARCWCASATPAGCAALAGTATNPFDSQKSGARAPAAARSRATPGNAATGVATTTSDAAAAVASVLVTASESGSTMPGRYLSLLRRAAIAAACAASRAQSVTARSSRRDRWAASAVPQAPAPTMAIVLRVRTPARSARIPPGRRDA